MATLWILFRQRYEYYCLCTVNIGVAGGPCSSCLHMLTMTEFCSTTKWISLFASSVHRSMVSRNLKCTWLSLSLSNLQKSQFSLFNIATMLMFTLDVYVYKKIPQITKLKHKLQTLRCQNFPWALLAVSPGWHFQTHKINFNIPSVPQLLLHHSYRYENSVNVKIVLQRV